MFMNYIGLLNINQIVGENKINIIKKYGTKARVTDFYVLLDGFVLNNYHIDDGFSLKDRTGMWFTSSSYNDDSSYVIDHRGCKNIINNIRRQSGIRPVLLWNNTSKNSNKIIELEYGEYPQNVVEKEESSTLEFLYNMNELSNTGKIYNLDCPHNSNSSAKFMERHFTEYIYNNKKYIRFVTDNSYCNGNLLSDGRKIYPNHIYWINVEPITWIVDYKNCIAISKDILLAGIQYNNYNKINKQFEESDIYEYLNNYFIKDIIPNNTNIRKKIKVNTIY